MGHKRCFGCQVGGVLSVIGLTITGAVAMPQSVLANPGLVSQQISWSDLWGLLRRTRKDQGGKGQLCLLVPAQAELPDVMWHDRPLFVWRGLEQTIGLRRTDSETVFWRRSLTQPGILVNQIQYTGLPLQPGHTYELLLFSSSIANQPVRWQAFTIMSARDRVPITTALQALTTKLERENASVPITTALQALTTKLERENASEAAIAQQRAQYFSEHHLPADGWQEIYRVKQPSKALKQFATAIATDFCSSP